MKKIILVFSIISLVLFFNAIKGPAEWSEYVVSSGDTVYGISIDITPDGEDYRETEYWITKKNNIQSAMIHPGQTILVPVYE